MKMRLFLGSAVLTLALFIACNAGSGEELLDNYAASHTPPPEGNYIISIFVTDVEGQGSAYASIEDANKERFDDITTANKGQTVILTVIPPGITEAEDSGEGDPVYYFVAPITGYYEGKDGTPKTYNAFKRSPNVSNEYTFTMPAGNVTVNISFTDKVDETSAFLRWFGVSDGSYTVNLKDPFEYTVTVSPDSEEEFYIYAQAENQDAALMLQQGNPGAGDDLSGQTLTLTEGLNNYTISVTSQDGNTTNQYRIKVIKLPDLSLKIFNIKKGSEFERDLAQQAAQDVYVTDRDGLEIVAEPADPSVTVSPRSPVPVPTLNENPAVPTVVTVTVSKPLSGVAEEYTAKSHILNVHYADTDLTPLAAGGIVSFLPDENSGHYYEVHTFTADGAALGGQAAHTLSFSGVPYPNTVEVLVVAGGGGGGGSDGARWTGSGGGAGRFVYHPAFKTGAGESWDTPGTITVKVGSGGPKGASGNGSTTSGVKGGNGGDSEFVRHSAYRIIAKGGGGGGNESADNSTGKGNDGGSGGGSHEPHSGASALAGTVPNEAGVLNYGNSGTSYMGGGAGANGAGAQSDISGQLQEYACGGLGGQDIAAANGTGNGGGGARANIRKSTNGGSGIVIVRFLRP